MNFKDLILMIETSKNLKEIIAHLASQFPTFDIHNKTESISLFCMYHGNKEEALSFLDSTVSKENGLMSNALSILACFYSTDPAVLNFILKHLKTNKHKDIIWVYYNMSFNLDMSYVDECIDKYCADKEKIKAWVRRLNNQRKRT